MTMNGREFLRETTRRIDQDLISNSCNLNFEEQIIKQNEDLGDSSIERRLRNLSDIIRQHRTYDGLRIAMRQIIMEFEQALTNEIAEQSALIAQFAPLLQIPTNPIAAVRFIKKLILGDVFPQIKAAIRMTRRIVLISFAISELAREIDEAINYLENYVRNFSQEFEAEQLAAIQRIQFAVQAGIQNFISEAICEDLVRNGVTANDINSFYDALNNLRLIRDDLRFAQSNVNQLLSDEINSINQIQNDISAITGVPPAIDTSSIDNYIESLNRGDDTTFIEANEQIASIPAPRNIVAPSIVFVSNSQPITGNVNVTSALTILEGDWEGPVDSTSFEWYSGATLVANTQTFTPDANTINKPLKAVVIKENFSGIIEAQAPIIPNVDNPFTFTANILQPVIIGTAQVGQTLTCSNGLWDGTSPLTFSFQWEYAKTGEPIIGETFNTYTVDDEDVNRTLRCRVTATNLLGSNSTFSVTTSRVVE